MDFITTPKTSNEERIYGKQPIVIIVVIEVIVTTVGSKQLFRDNHKTSHLIHLIVFHDVYLERLVIHSIFDKFFGIQKLFELNQMGFGHAFGESRMNDFSLTNDWHEIIV
jgi:hypothetical protein